MKLVINVDEYKIESCKRRKKEGWNEWYHNMILEGKPFNDELVKEFEKLKEKIEQMDFDLGDYYDHTDTIIEMVSNVIDKHIAKIKGESR